MRFLAILCSLVFLTFPAFADSDLDCQVVSETINPTEAQATDDYINLTDGTFDTTAAAEDEFIVPVEVKVWGLFAEVANAPAAADWWDIFVVDDGTNTLVTCRIGEAATTCSNVNNVATVAAGSDLTILVDSGNGAGVPTTTAEMRVGFCIDLDR